MTTGERKAFKNALRTALRRRARGIPLTAQEDSLLIGLPNLRILIHMAPSFSRPGRLAPGLPCLRITSAVARERCRPNLMRASMSISAYEHP
jgi:hypothetical protein